MRRTGSKFTGALSPCHRSRCLTCVTSPHRASSQHEIYRHVTDWCQSVTSLATVKVLGFFFLHHPHYNQHLFSFQLLKCYISHPAAKTIISHGINNEAASVCQTLRKRKREKKVVNSVLLPSQQATSRKYWLMWKELIIEWHLRCNPVTRTGDL